MASRGTPDTSLRALGEWSSDEGTPAMSTAVRVAVACGASIVTAASVFLPWARAGLSGTPVVYAGTSIPGLTVPFVAGSVITVAAALVARFGRRPEALLIAALSAGITTAAAAGLIVALETVATLIPSSLLPATLRRLTIGVSAEVGLWVAFASALVATAAASGMAVPATLRNMHAPSRPGRPRAFPLTLLRTQVLGLLGIALVIVATVWLRYEYWIGASAAQEHLRLAGWTIPWVGPLSLLATAILIAGMTVVLLGRTDIGALMVAGAGWLTSFLAALVILTCDTMAQLRLNDLAPEQIRGYGPTFQLGWAAWVVFLVGLVAAAAAAAIIMSNDIETTGSGT
jgi:hypothetical protein